MKFLIHLLTPESRHKSIVVNAKDSKEAKKVASSQFPDHQIDRITSDEGSVDYFEDMKRIKNQIGQMNKGKQ